MHARDMLPWNWGRKNVHVRHGHREDGERHGEALLPSLGMSAPLDELFRRALEWPRTHFGAAESSAFLPALDATETDDEIRISLELPGMSEKDVEVSLENDTLTIRGEKREEQEREEHGGHWIERRYGSFQRSVPLPCEVKADAIQATFKKGVLRLVLPKSTTQRESRRTIEVAAE